MFLGGGFENEPAFFCDYVKNEIYLPLVADEQYQNGKYQ